MPQEHDRQRLLRPVFDPHRHQHLRLHQRLHNRAQRSLLPSELLLADYYILARDTLYYGRPRAVDYVLVRTEGSKGGPSGMPRVAQVIIPKDKMY